MATRVSTALLRLAQDTALAAGEFAARRRSEGVQLAASKSSPEDIVTLADRETESLIRALLATSRPDDGFLGEESTAVHGRSGLTWVVDPIDGTVNYLYGLPFWAVSIAVVEGDPDPATWTTLAGVVYNPTGDELFTAAVGEGTWLGNRRLQVAAAVPLSLALLGTGFSYRAAERERQADVVRGLIGQVRDIRRMGSAALDLCSLAAGRLNLYYERGLNPWDHAAGVLMAREAGAQVGGFGADREGLDLLLAGAPDLYRACEPILAKLFEDFMTDPRA
ncbi:MULTISPECIES: inositol monophosphatase family protein [Cryobacterium]|uniref:Inositol-1-monophosphatase n=1 Tax=Cryobacterium breve TaxID=1259258 RepID=A0ABY2IZF5_9MICO|nr:MULTISPECIES: inositol monophosphatase family protein [Cryobacterium]TFC96027.1 inositol monophosphatase [Cryobacterium sp. TmT3-12]TFC97999.1 inositol monophosphatase [Cryobacterium breve]